MNDQQFIAACQQRATWPDPIAAWRCSDCGGDLRETGRLVEVVITHTYVTFHDDDTAQIRESEPAYETCQTARVECGDCGQPLDDAHAARFLEAIRDDYRETIDPAAAAYLQAHGDD